MKLRNKKTGEIIKPTIYVNIHKKFYIEDAVSHDDGHEYDTLAELCEEWEDVPEEPKEWWYIDIHGPHKVTNDDEYYQQVKAASKEIGNYFETKEEAEQAVEKLKAWKRLKDKGLHVTTFYVEDGSLVIRAKTHNSSGAENWEDLDLLFGGENE